MGLPENDYQILRLTDAFYQAYPNPPYTEILKKRKRALKHKSALEFVEEYVAHMKGIEKLHLKEFRRRYAFSPLQYFHKELGITE